MHIVFSIAIMLLFLWELKRRRVINELQSKVAKYAVETNKHIIHLDDIIKVQNQYICALQDARAQTKSKVDELVSLLPEAQTIESKPAEHAAVIMFQTLEKARKLVEKHQPEGQLYKELSELLK